MSVKCILTLNGTKFIIVATTWVRDKKMINARRYIHGLHQLQRIHTSNNTCLFFYPQFFLSSSVCCRISFKIQRATFYISIKLRAVGIDQSADRFFSNNTPYMSSKALSVVEFSFTADKIAQLAASQLGRKSRRLCFPGKTSLLRVYSPKSFGLTIQFLRFLPQYTGFKHGYSFIRAFEAWRFDPGRCRSSKQVIYIICYIRYCFNGLHFRKLQVEIIDEQ